MALVLEDLSSSLTRSHFKLWAVIALHVVSWLESSIGSPGVRWLDGREILRLDAAVVLRRVLVDVHVLALVVGQPGHHRVREQVGHRR